ncbi:hypothetical protein JCM5353_004870 [Sporobolomyces roseus]
MSDSSRRNQKKCISYAEVDSDIDLDSDQEHNNTSSSSNKDKGGVKKAAGDTYGTTEGTARSKKRARKTTSKKSQAEQDEEEDEPVVYDPKLLLSMPFDIFAETCSHLEGADLISFAQVNKSFRRILLSKGAQTIWTTRRKSDGYPLPDDLNELQFAMLVYGKACQNCGESNPKKVTLHHALRRSLCDKCRKVVFIARSKVRSAQPSLHAQAIHCVRIDGKNSRRRRFQYHVLEELVAVDGTLKELEEEDEIILDQIDKLKYKSSTRSRRKESTVVPVADNVKTFVEARQEWIAKEEKLTEKMEKASKRLRRAEREALEVEKQRYRERLIEHVAASAFLKKPCGWSREERKQFFDKNGYFTPVLGESGVPRKWPQDDVEAWKSYRSKIQKVVAKQREDQARRDRRQAVKVYYPLAIEAVIDPSAGILPDLYEFIELPKVRLLWNPVGADDSEAAFTKLLESIVEDIEDHQEKSKIHAIRSILAAKRDVPISTLSLESSAYPSEEYDSDFFELATSVYCKRSSKKVFTFPELVDIGENQNYLISSLDLRQTDAVIAMIEAAGLDTETAKWKDLVQLGPRFKWTNETPFPAGNWWMRHQYTSKAVWDCEQLLCEILLRGPNENQINAGDGVEIELVAKSTLSV